MTRALIIKELRQHWLPFLLLSALLPLGFLLILGVAGANDVGSWFEAVRRFLIVMLPLGILVLCNRLVVREYQSQTQLFLEALPIPRSRMITVKYLLGLTLTMFAAGSALLMTSVISLRSEPLTVRFLAIMAVRAGIYSWCIFSFFFMMGLLGRYRVAIYLLGILGLFAIDTLTRVELSRFGPFALMNEQFAYERHEIPERALLVALAIGTVFTGLTWILSLMREGSVAALLAERMSHREKVTVTALILAILFAISIYDERIEKKPFDLPNAIEARRGEVTVKVAADTFGGDAQAARLARLVADEVAAAQQYLNLSDPPPIFVTHWQELDADRFEHGKLENAEGLLVRANLSSPDWQDERFLFWLLRELLVAWSHGRLEREQSLWVLDGFPVYWTSRDASPVRPELEQLELRAAHGARHGFSSADATHWLRYRERVGAEIAAAVAWRGLESLQRQQGAPRCRAFLRAALDCDVPADWRGMLHDWSHPLPQLLAREGGVEFPAFVANWTSDLDNLVQVHGDELLSIPEIRGEIVFDALSAHTRRVRFCFDSVPPPESGRFALLYKELSAFEVQVEDSEIRREDAIYPDQRLGELPGTFGRRTRFYSTFAVWHEGLGCEAISGWTRREMP